MGEKGLRNALPESEGINTKDMWRKTKGQRVTWVKAIHPAKLTTRDTEAYWLIGSAQNAAKAEFETSHTLCYLEMERLAGKLDKSEK